MEKKIKLLIVSVVILIAFAGGACSQGPKELTVHESEGFVDLQFTITDATREDGVYHVAVENRYRGNTLGFQVRFDSDWKKSEISDNVYIHWGTGAVIANPEPYGVFMSALSGLYKVPEPENIADTVPMSIVMLQGDPYALEVSPAKMKLFFEFEKGEEYTYAEVYLNLDKRNGILQLSEKDTGYREALVKALSGNAE